VENRRKGKAVNMTIEVEALDIMRTLCPNGKSFGKFLSDLIRAEEQRRIEARKWREKLYDVVEEVLAP
jgi:hypothetical protein